MFRCHAHSFRTARTRTLAARLAHGLANPQQICQITFTGPSRPHCVMSTGTHMMYITLMPSVRRHLCSLLYALMILLSSLKCAAVCGRHTNFSPPISTVLRGGKSSMVSAITQTALATSSSTKPAEGSLYFSAIARPKSPSSASTIPFSTRELCFEYDGLDTLRPDPADPPTSDSRPSNTPSMDLVCTILCHAKAPDQCPAFLWIAIFLRSKPILLSASSANLWKGSPVNALQKTRKLKLFKFSF